MCGISQGLDVYCLIIQCWCNDIVKTLARFMKQVIPGSELIFYSLHLFTAVCPAGQEYKEDTDECVPCAVGKYKTVGDRFGVCAICDVGFTTDGEGKTSAADCSISKYQHWTPISA